MDKITGYTISDNGNRRTQINIHFENSGDRVKIFPSDDHEGQMKWINKMYELYKEKND